MRTMLPIVALLASTLGPCRPALAQTGHEPSRWPPIKISPQPQRQSQGEIVKVTGRNVSSSVPPLRIPPQLKMPKPALPGPAEKPPVIGAPTLLQLVGGKGGLGSYADLSLKSPAAVGKASLSFLSPLFILADDEGTPLPTFAAGHGLLSIKINALSANSLYLVDCAVDNKTMIFSVAEMGDDSVPQLPQEIATKNGHILFLLDAPHAGWYQYTISNLDVAWTLYSCNVSSLK
jgi:hypothetical protein